MESKTETTAIYVKSLRTYKIFVLGTKNTGKSAYIYHLLGGKDKPDNPDKISFRFCNQIVDNEPLRLMMCECPGSIKLETITKCLKDTQAFMIFVDCNDYAGFVEILDFVKTNCPSVPLIVVFNVDQSRKEMEEYMFNGHKTFNMNSYNFTDVDRPVHYLLKQISKHGGKKPKHKG